MRREMPFLPEVKKEIVALRQEVVEQHEACHGVGYIDGSIDGTVHRCECMTVFRWLKELVKARIPRDYWHLSLDSLQSDDESKKIVRMFLKNIDNAKKSGLGIVFLGPNGVGKTSAMAEIGKGAILAGYKVRYFTLATWITAQYKKNEELRENLEFGDFLLIDEIDKQGDDKNTIRNVDEFLRRMFNANKSIFMATNWSEEELQKRLGESTVSLLKRRCMFYQMIGDDFSESLTDQVLDKLQSNYDYWNDNIRRAAKKMEVAGGVN